MNRSAPFVTGLLCLALLWPALPLPAEALASDGLGATNAATAPRPTTARRGPVWVAALNGRSLELAWNSGAELLDRFPDAVVVADAASASALASAGFRVDGPITVGEGESVTVLRATAAGARAADLDAATFARLGARGLWRSDRLLLVASTRPLGGDPALAPFSRQALRTAALHRPPAAGLQPSKPLSTSFEPIISEMVAQVDSASFIAWIRNLSGGNPVLVGGYPVTFDTRYTPTPWCDQAEQYVYEQFLAMGYTDVQYDPYSFSGTNARNVVATLPGTGTPSRIVIVGGHLDSTSGSPNSNAPGANDNASGVAAVLAIAGILKNYEFQSTIRFIAFTGEEQGLYGSQHYAQMVAARGDDIAGVVICDMISYHFNRYSLLIEGQAPWDWLMQIMNDACQTFTGLGTQLSYNSWGSDHVPFQNEGYPAFLAIESDYGAYTCYHQTCDTWEKQQAAMGAEVTRACLATAAHVAGRPAFFIDHTPLPSTENTTGPYEVLAQISQLDSLVPGSPLLHYSVGWSYFELPLTQIGASSSYHAFIPGQAAVTRVQYYLTAADVEGRSTASPDSAPVTVHEFHVGPRATIFSEGFEGGGAGWTHGGTLDDWQCAAPLGLAEDPANAHSGTNVYGTDLTGLGANSGRYENNCNTWLESPPIDCSQRAGVTLTFWRWLAVDRSSSGTRDRARISVNGVQVWENPSASSLIDPDWTYQEFDIGSIADRNPSVQIRFTLQSNPSVVYGGWNLDDIALSGITTVTTTDATESRLPRLAILYPSVPNPCNPATTIRFDLPARAVAELSIYDVRGQLVRTLVRRELDPGPHRILWDGTGGDGFPSASGVYLYRLSTPETSQTRKLALVR